MLARLLVVVLFVLNACVGLWWWWRPALVADGENRIVASTSTSTSTSTSVPGLVLVDEASLALPEPPPANAAEIGPDSAPDEAGGDGEATAAVEEAQPAEPAPQVAVQPAPKPVPAVCARLGDLGDKATVTALRTRLGKLVTDVREQTVPPGATSTWKVMIPPAANRQAAEQMAQRIAGAGFADMFVIPQGELAHAVALGQFRNRDGAQRRLDALLAAGFPAVMAPGTPASALTALQVRLAEGASLEQLRARAGQGVRTQSIDCGALR